MYTPEFNILMENENNTKEPEKRDPVIFYCEEERGSAVYGVIHKVNDENGNISVVIGQRLFPGEELNEDYSIKLTKQKFNDYSYLAPKGVSGLAALDGKHWNVLLTESEFDLARDTKDQRENIK